jgi:hypothetical protein
MIVQDIIEIVYRIKKKGTKIEVRRTLYNRSKNRS